MRTTPQQPQFGALYLGETVDELNDGANFLDRLSADELSAVRRLGHFVGYRRGETVFLQGMPHNGIFLIEHGSIRCFYTAPSGREITLAYWTPGHFVGGPEIFRGGVHIWSGVAAEDSALLHLRSAKIHRLVETMPHFAMCLIEGLVAKSKCYSALVQMLGTRSAVERLAQLLIILGQVYGRNESGKLVVQRKVTHEQLSQLVGVTRQWVTKTLDRFQRQGIVSLGRQRLVIECPDRLLSNVSDRGTPIGNNKRAPSTCKQKISLAECQ